MARKVNIAAVLILFILASIAPDAFAFQQEQESFQITDSITSQALIHDETPKQHKLSYKVYLPSGYDKKRKEGYPVLYLLHGSNGNENSWDEFWPKLDEMIEKGVIDPVIAVVPSTGNSYWVDSEKYGHYESAVIQDLIPKIDKKYNTKKDRTGRYISGYSMGGYGALRYSLTYPDLFAGTVLLSPAIQKAEPPATSGAVERGSFGEPYDPEIWTSKNYPTGIDSYVKQPHRLPIYIVTGDDDWNHLSEKEDLPADAYQYNMEVQAVQLYQELHRKNLFAADFEKWEDVPANPAELRIINGGHGLDVWLKGFEEGLKYLFGKPEAPEFSPVYDASEYISKRKGTVTSKILGEDAGDGEGSLPYQVYLPPGYNAEENKHYPVLYLLHGSWGDKKSWDKFWPILDKKIESKEISPVIAVAPITGNSYWVDSEKYGAVETAVVSDLVNEIDQTYKTIASREGRGLVGYSMGGYGALRYALTYPDKFAAASLLSPALQHDEAPATSGAVERGSFGEPFNPALWDALNYPAALEQYGKQPYEVPVYIYAGDDNWNHVSEKEDLPEDSWKYNMEVQAVTLYEHLHRSNVFNRPFEKWEEVPGSPAELRILNGGHDTNLWGRGFEEGLEYMFGNGLSGAEMGN
ncbi:alpha/beta fold hydrolase [Bacillus infantis]|uniref:alpha/beta hydrolase n=1 Tax=Bacillus infantis TaxID=324767 RepID=UPI002FBE0D26